MINRYKFSLSLFFPTGLKHLRELYINRMAITDEGAAVVAGEYWFTRPFSETPHCKFTGGGGHFDYQCVRSVNPKVWKGTHFERHSSHRLYLYSMISLIAEVKYLLSVVWVLLVCFA